MCLDSLRRSECLNDKCTSHHIKGTNRQPKLIKNNQQDRFSILPERSFQVNHGLPERSDQVNHDLPERSDQVNHDKDPYTAEHEAQADTPAIQDQEIHFLEVIRLMKAEILSTMNQKIASLTTQFQRIQPMVYPSNLMPYMQPPMLQTNPQLMFTPQVPRGTQQQPPRVRIQTPHQI